ncbi:MAG: acetylornithine/succinylornithine family transaminase [Lachnospiraceae bacterium]|nr:acetylornithine/succinylornithine family transaminase [Lachnospiraceae bacterium]
MALGEGSLLHTYNRLPLVIDHGDGMYLYDVDGKAYLDFCAGIAVFALGYADPHVDAGLKDQIGKIVHTSNYFYNEPAVTAAARLTAFAGMDRVFFTNSGTEAVEGALKLARRYQLNRGREGRYEIVAMEHSFHGRSMGALSVTGKPAYRAPFEPLIGGVKFVEPGDIESLLDAVDEKTAAILLEPIQGEGGIVELSDEYMKEVRAICDERDIVMIADEIQCGLGRTGQDFAWQKSGAEPDVLLLAKAMGCGIPCGAILCKEDFAALVPGDHGSTFGGNPLAGRAVNLFLDRYEELDLAKNAAKVGDYMKKKLTELAEEMPQIVGLRGRGLMQGVVLAPEVGAGAVMKLALEERLVVITAEGNIVRLLPPLIVKETDVDVMIPRLKAAILRAAEA